MVVAHLGCGVCIAGMASESAFTQENLSAMAVGETQSVGPWQITLEGLREVPGPNYLALEGVLSATRSEGTAHEFLPQLRSFSDPPMQTTQASIKTFWDGQLYLVVGEGAADGRWLVRMWWKPFVTLIWLGGALIALGGALSLLGRVRRDIWKKQAAPAIGPVEAPA